MSASSPPMSEGKDRRRHRRVPVAAPARLLLDQNERSAQCVNLSMGGAALRSDVDVRAGSLLRIQVNLDGERRVRTVAEVVRSAGHDIGVRFVQLDPASMLAILSSVR